MPTVSTCIEIARPVEQVFEIAGDYRNDVYWRRGVIGIELEPPGSLAVGTITRERIVRSGNLAMNIARVTEFERYRRTRFEALYSPVSYEGCRSFEPTHSGTRFTYSLTLRPRGLHRLMGLALASMIKKQVKHDLRHLKVLLERDDDQLSPVSNVQTAEFNSGAEDS